MAFLIACMYKPNSYIPLSLYILMRLIIYMSQTTHIQLVHRRRRDVLRFSCTLLAHKPVSAETEHISWRSKLRRLGRHQRRRRRRRRRQAQLSQCNTVFPVLSRMGVVWMFGELSTEATKHAYLALTPHTRHMGVVVRPQGYSAVRGRGGREVGGYITVLI